MFIRPTLTRQVSDFTINQKYGTCYAHAATRVIVKFFKVKFPEIFGTLTKKQFKITSQIKSRITSIFVDSECKDLYLRPHRLFDCKKGVCKITNEIERLCKNKYEKNGIIFYAFIFTLIVKKHGCDGGWPQKSIKYVFSVIFTKSVVSDGCLISRHCAVVKQIIDRFKEYIKTNGLPIIEKVSCDSPKFYETVKKVIDSELYLVFSGNTLLMCNTFEFAYNAIAGTGNHATVLVDYDLSNNENPIIYIKNSWGRILTTTFVAVEKKHIKKYDKFCKVVYITDNPIKPRKPAKPIRKTKKSVVPKTKKSGKKTVESTDSPYRMTRTGTKYHVINTGCRYLSSATKIVKKDELGSCELCRICARHLSKKAKQNRY